MVGGAVAVAGTGTDGVTVNVTKTFINTKLFRKKIMRWRLYLSNDK